MGEIWSQEVPRVTDAFVHWTHTEHLPFGRPCGGNGEAGKGHSCPNLEGWYSEIAIIGGRWWGVLRDWRNQGKRGEHLRRQMRPRDCECPEQGRCGVWDTAFLLLGVPCGEAWWEQGPPIRQWVLELRGKRGNWKQLCTVPAGCWMKQRRIYTWGRHGRLSGLLSQWHWTQSKTKW